MLGLLSDEPATIRLEEAHRFSHEPLDTPAGPVWDLTKLWREVLHGIRAAAVAAAEAGVLLRSLGADTWGVDWTLVEPGGELLSLPHAYRDPAHSQARDRLLERLPGGVESLYRRTGIQPQPFNTLFQLEARRAVSTGLFDVDGATLLMLPDLLHFWLTGHRGVERTNASTTSLLAADSGEWDRELLDLCGIPHHCLGRIVESGDKLGRVRPSLAVELGLPEGVEVVAPATHDTASAVAAVPAVGEPAGGWAYLSSGTWSLLGVELEKPNTSSAALSAGFTNELGVGGRVRFLRNIAGLWLVQELRRDLERDGQSFGYAELAELARGAEPLRTLIDPDAKELAEPGESIAKLRAQAERTGQPMPQTAGQLARCCLESLALCYAETIDKIESLTDHKIQTLYVVGGGANNDLLNELTAGATGRTVRIGPSESTALGNALVQAMGLGLIADLNEVREIVSRSQPVGLAAQGDATIDWASARQRYRELVPSV